MSIKTLDDLFFETLKDIYYAEKKLVKSLPKMAKSATNPDLASLITEHCSETEMQVQRLEQVFDLLGKKPASKKCEAIEGLLREANEIMDEIEDEQVCDSGIISSSQTVEHYEIARYGTLAAWARELGMQDAAELLETTLDEEKAADQKLSALAESEENHRAAA
jgi:ferritin-like metal-binding protein YciE